jgi:hypothetical protein
VELSELAPPRTAAVVAATEVAQKFALPSLFDHARRSYLWGASYAAIRDLSYDRELFYVAAILHDLGLEKPFDSWAIPFEEAGGYVAWVFTAGAGWPTARRDRVVEIIVRHMHDDVTAEVDAESHLLQAATSLDVSGRNADQWPAALRQQVLREVPRGTLAEDFVACFGSQAIRKPRSAAATAMESGLAERAYANPLDRVASEATPG